MEMNGKKVSSVASTAANIIIPEVVQANEIDFA